jgi:predicted DNA-binding transcriptional regulator AlpA
MTSRKGPRRLISSAEVDRRVPYSRVHRWRLEQLPPEKDPFPRRIPIGENRIAYDEDEVQAWIERRIRKSTKIAGPRAKRTPLVDDWEAG